MGDSEDKFFDIRQLLGDTLLITRTVNYKYFRDELKSVPGDLKVTGRAEVNGTIKLMYFSKFSS